jgi:predicted RNase H-like HicB family nuclease
MQIIFTVSPDETGGFVARWDDPLGGGIVTQGENLAELQEMVRDAVDGISPTEMRRDRNGFAEAL